MDESFRETQPDGSLVPPTRVPPTAVATAAPLPPPRSTPLVRNRMSWNFRRLVDGMLDTLDTLGDGIASTVGLR
jgi:hypothetical protein